MTKQIKERFDALSDAIIAIIMTILVLEIKIPSSSKELPSFAYAIGLFLISFVIVFNFWYRRTQIVLMIHCHIKLSYKMSLLICY